MYRCWGGGGDLWRKCYSTLGGMKEEISICSQQQIDPL